jgi:hypothetical protein
MMQSRVQKLPERGGVVMAIAKATAPDTAVNKAAQNPNTAAVNRRDGTRPAFAGIVNEPSLSAVRIASRL